MQNVNRLTAILFILPMMFMVSCRKDKRDQIPYAYVNIFIEPNGTMYQNLNNVGGWEYLTANEPSRGIIVYRASTEQFMAYERTCPYDPSEETARIEVETSGITAVDSTCMSRFILLDGTPFSGPSTLSMKQYQTYYDGNLLHIFN
jgi:nitrite reductase/ring-hydroxylating ferredoxin subunit